MKRDLHIPGGYILYPRDFLDLLDEAPLLDRVLWVWLNCRANHKDGHTAHGQLRRGQLLATIPEMRRALSHRAGRSLRTPSKAAVWRALCSGCIRPGRGIMPTDHAWTRHNHV